MTFAAAAPALIQAAATIGSSILSNKGKAGSETKLQRTQRKLIDQLIASLNGDGPFSNLFSADYDTFQKSFVEPAQSLFQNQIAPQIQQQYIASGQQRGTGLDDTLTRAGVDLDAMLNQQYYQFQKDALDRQIGVINSTIGAGSGAKNDTSTGQDVMSSLSGYLNSSGFSDTVSNIFKNNNLTEPQQQRKGFEND